MYIVHKQSQSNSVDLWSIIQDEWHKIPEDYIIKRYESIPRRLDVVIHEKRLHTKSIDMRTYVTLYVVL